MHTGKLSAVVTVSGCGVFVRPGAKLTVSVPVQLTRLAAWARTGVDNTRITASQAMTIGARRSPSHARDERVLMNMAISFWRAVAEGSVRIAGAPAGPQRLLRNTCKLVAANGRSTMRI